MPVIMPITEMPKMITVGFDRIWIPRKLNWEKFAPILPNAIINNRTVKMMESVRKKAFIGLFFILVGLRVSYFADLCLFAIYSSLLTIFLTNFHIFTLGLFTLLVLFFSSSISFSFSFLSSS